MNAPQKVPLLALRREAFDVEVGRILEAAGQPRYRLKQLWDWLYRRTPPSFADMQDLPASLRERLDETCQLHPLVLRERRVSNDGTQKFLWQFGDGASAEILESVLIPDADRVTYCISSQLGCPVKCPFCATGFSGFRGQLGTAEIIDQVLQMRDLTGQPPTNIVYMGMGEPLLNFDAVLGALEALTDPSRVAFGARRITVSTVGIPERIEKLSQLFPQVKVALSLHAAVDALRDELVPLNKQYPLDDVLTALRAHQSSTGRVPTMEYVVLPGVNDRAADAEALGRRLAGLRCRINLIGFNPFQGVDYQKPTVEELTRFREAIRERFDGAVTIRRSRGEDIDGACGQLALKQLGSE